MVQKSRQLNARTYNIDHAPLHLNFSTTYRNDDNDDTTVGSGPTREFCDRSSALDKISWHDCQLMYITETFLSTGQLEKRTQTAPRQGALA